MIAMPVMFAILALLSVGAILLWQWVEMLQTRRRSLSLAGSGSEIGLRPCPQQSPDLPLPENTICKNLKGTVASVETALFDCEYLEPCGGSLHPHCETVIALHVSSESADVPAAGSFSLQPSTAINAAGHVAASPASRWQVGRAGESVLLHRRDKLLRPAQIRKLVSRAAQLTKSSPNSILRRAANM